jgi:ATP-dependent DNA helicase DinG
MILPIEQMGKGLEGRVREMFGAKGLLSKARNFEYRPEQQEMAAGVARALENQRHFVVEAGTGVGKSLAYLLPAILQAHEQGKKALVSTHTINLQEQLFYKDLPLVEKLLPFDFKTALLKGRQNYICPHRLAKAMASAGDLFVSSEQAELQRIWDWMQKTTDGTLSDFETEPDYKVWSQVCSESHVCTSKTCGGNPRCFYQQARKRIIEADLVILNHTLFFTCLGGMDDETTAEEGYLFPNDFVIFDEAHNLELTAARHIGLSLSSSALRYQLQKLYHPTTHKGLLSIIRNAPAQARVNEVWEASDEFFGQVEAACQFKQGGEFRVRKPELARDTLSLPLMNLRQSLLDALEGVEDESQQMELRDMCRRLVMVRDDLKTFLAQEREDYVYWVERTGRDRSSLTLLAAPVDLAEVLRQYLFRPGHTAVLTSATLSVHQGLSYFQKRVGAEEADSLQLDSPFDFAKQMKVFIPRQMPDPKDQEYESHLEKWVEYFTRQTGGHALVLFTSYALMHRLAGRMREWFESQGMKLLVQGTGMSRRLLVDSFKSEKNGVLFGTDSFWQGVDIPGAALTNVILTRLPFAVPEHPLVQAKLEWIEERGGDPFADYSLPEAVLKFRQGVGRLIRTASDQGQVAILDNRILSKGYGKTFLAKLPKCPVVLLENEVLDHQS